MLPASRRLRTKEVEDIIKRGISARGVFITAKALKNSDTMDVRAAAVISKKIAKSAVERNRVRRALYRAVAEVAEKTKLNIVFFIRSIPPDPLAPAFEKDVATILKSLTTIR